MIIRINRGGKEVRLNKLHNELVSGTSAGIGIKTVVINDAVIKVISDIDLSEQDVSDVVDIISQHSPDEVTPLEIKEKELRYPNDYLRSREEAKGLVTDFSALSDMDKEIAAKYCLTDDATIVGYYMSKGLDQTTAISKHKVRRATDIHKAAKSCRNRVENPVVKYLAIKYLSEDDASAFLEATKSFMVDYKEAAHLGLNYGQSRDGIMDYIEATNGYAGAGLSSYTFNDPLIYDECKEEFKQYLVYGNRPIEFDEFSS